VILIELAMDRRDNWTSYREALLLLPDSGINLRTVDGHGSHIGPIYVTRMPHGDDRLLLAPRRDTRDEDRRGDLGRLIVDRLGGCEATLTELDNNATLILLDSGHQYEVFGRYIDVIRGEYAGLFSSTKRREDFYLRSWDSPVEELTFPEDPRYN
jgi:hypothetical protein|tara:strand:- start:6963 stop:7427 length:465 start_codon:yes stop_codon:yes gene_type:complete